MTDATGPNVDISLLLPTRGRPHALEKSLSSLWSNSRLRSYEVLLAIDDDDSATFEILKSLPGSAVRQFVFPRFGYHRLHEYVNVLCGESKGEWLFLWNDDAIMETSGWDKVIGSFSGRSLLLNPSSNHGPEICVFPIVPRVWTEVLGHFSLNSHNDSWMESIAKKLGVMTQVPITVLHDRVDLTGGNDDATARERTFMTSEFYSTDMQAMIESDVLTLRNAGLGTQGQ